jgi:hypothetical protein
MMDGDGDGHTWSGGGLDGAPPAPTRSGGDAGELRRRGVAEGRRPAVGGAGEPQRHRGSGETA